MLPHTIVCLCSVMSDSLYPMNYSPLGFSVHGILQARILEWTAISFLGDLLNPGIKPASLTLQADSLLSGNPLQHSSLENSMGREALRAVVHGV